MRSVICGLFAAAVLVALLAGVATAQDQVSVLVRPAAPQVQVLVQPYVPPAIVRRGVFFRYTYVPTQAGPVVVRQLGWPWRPGFTVPQPVIIHHQRGG